MHIIFSIISLLFKSAYAVVAIAISLTLFVFTAYIGILYVLPIGIAGVVTYFAFMGLSELVTPKVNNDPHSIHLVERLEREDLRKELQEAGASEANIVIAVAALRKEQDTPYVRPAKKVVNPLLKKNQQTARKLVVNPLRTQNQ